MFGKLFNDLAEVVTDTAKVVAAPAAVLTSAARQTVKPLAEAAEEIVSAVTDGDTHRE